MHIIINIKKLLLIAAIPFLFSASCKKNKSKPCPNGDIYSFSVTSDFTQQKQVYNIGDTIFFNSILSKNLIDKLTNQNIDYSNSVGIYGNVKAIYMDTLTHTISDSMLCFQPISIIGTFDFIQNNQNRGLNILYLQSNNDYKSKVAFICKSKGLFYLGVTNLGSQGIIGKDCTNAGFDMTVTNSNKNFNLFQYALGYTPDLLLQKSIYCFRVQ